MYVHFIELELYGELQFALLTAEWVIYFIRARIHNIYNILILLDTNYDKSR